MTVLLEARRLSAGYGGRRVLSDLTLRVRGPGSGVGIIGDSGAGKTTAMLALARLIPLDSGTLTVAGQDVSALRGRRLRSLRRLVQIVPQEGDTPLDPRLRVADAVAEGLLAHRIVPRAQCPAAVADLLRAVGLDGDLAPRRPHELSGGQRQRVAVARALAVRPRLLIADEPTSALDPVSRNLVVEVLRGLLRTRGLALVVVSHDLAVVGALCDDVAVLLGGRVVEQGPLGDVTGSPAHPYTAALVAAERRLAFGPGPAWAAGEQCLAAAPDAAAPLAATGCAYRPRCPRADARCLDRPSLDGCGPGRRVACHHRR
jgi:peptide/nickel transport system ATP-binding protein